MTKFYITSSIYAGPNPDQNVDADTYQISTEPGRKNGNNEIAIQGWLGTSNNWAHYAHGVFETEESARKEIENLLDDGFREVEDIPDYHTYEGVVAEFKPGKLEPWNAESSETWIWPGVEQEVTADTSDSEIEEMINRWSKEAEDDGIELMGDLADSVIEYRDGLKEDQE